jgi:hypothetical protein
MLFWRARNGQRAENPSSSAKRADMCHRWLPHSTVLFWRAEYSVGFAEIDSQHKLLVKLINNLQEAMYEGRGKDALAHPGRSGSLHGNPLRL